MPGLPVPNAGADQSFAYNPVPFDVNLTGAGVDPDGFPILSWQWTLLYKPAGSAAFIQNPTAQNPVLKNVDLQGTYEPFLQVTSQNGSSQAATVPGIFSAVDSAFTHVVHRTQTQSWRVPARYERSWTEHINAILFALDTVAGGAAPASATYLVLSGPPASLPNAENTSALSAGVLFQSGVGVAAAPITAKASAVGTLVLDLQDDAGLSAFQFRKDGNVLLLADAGPLWPVWHVLQNVGLGDWLVFSFPGTPNEYRLALLPDGQALIGGTRATINARATAGGGNDVARLNFKGELPADVATGALIFDATNSRFEMSAANVPSTALAFHFGEDGYAAAVLEPGFVFNGSDGVEARPAYLLWLANTKTMLMTDGAAAKFDKFQIDARIVLDVDDEILAAKSIEFDGNIVQGLYKSGAQAMQVVHRDAQPLEIGTDNTVWWRVLATGEIEADGAGGRIENLLAPVSGGEAANKDYVDAVALFYAVTTADATPTVLAALAIAADSGERIEVDVSARQAAGSANRQWYTRVLDCTRVGAGAVLVNTTVSVPDGDVGAPAWTLGVAANGNNIEVTVTGIAATTILWRARVRRVAAV